MSGSPPDGDFFPLVYDERRRLAAAELAGEPAGHSLDATALVHEAYLRLGGGAFVDRSMFMRAAAVAVQRILVDHARRKRAARRGGRAGQFAVAEGDRVIVSEPDTLLDIDSALTRLAAEDAASADLARFRLFAGLSIDEAALALGLSRATAFREWAYAGYGNASRQNGPSSPRILHICCAAEFGFCVLTRTRPRFHLLLLDRGVG
jgi:RNA polymerase sigma factor (TIGR02999 family)